MATTLYGNSILKKVYPMPSYSKHTGWNKQDQSDGTAINLTYNITKESKQLLCVIVLRHYHQHEQKYF